MLVKLLEKVGLDKAMHSGSVGQYVNKAAPDFSPSRVIGVIAFWFIFLGALSIAVSQLGIPALNTFVASIAAYLPNVVAALLIFVVAGVIAAAVGGLVARTMGDTPTGKVVGSVVPVLVMAIATFMILNQLKIAPEIVTITYAALIGGVFLAMALAFGLGGREVAGQMLGDAYDKGQAQRGQVKQDMRTGKDRAQRDAQTGQGQGRRAHQRHPRRAAEPASGGLPRVAAPLIRPPPGGRISLRRDNETMAAPQTPGEAGVEGPRRRADAARQGCSPPRRCGRPDSCTSRPRGARSSTVASSRNGLGDASITASCRPRTVSAADVAGPVRRSDSKLLLCQVIDGWGCPGPGGGGLEQVP